MGAPGATLPAIETESYRRLRRLLDELFQFDQAELDFGIYRIMNQKRAEIGRFLDEDLLPQVRTTLADYRAGEQDTLRAELDRLRSSLQAAGVQPETAPRYRELQDQLASLGGTADLENEVYSDLYTFFRRYYNEGDFISLRRYKAGVYAIPYEGEEVKLHWVNADQYYVKTTEAFQDYRFRLPDGRHVHFRLVAAEIERDNNKAADDQERRFVLRRDEPVAEIKGELHIRFAYHPNKEKQEIHNAQAVETLLGLPGLRGWKEGLASPMPTASNGSRTLLAKHLADYTAKNSFDYFIHKDLGGFLRRELDFFLKNEVLSLDDLDTDDERRADQYLARLRAIKRIGGKLIAFLAQLEDFQKRLFLKKKFVVAAEYCLTLDHVPEALHDQIVSNEAQWAEWERLFVVGELPNADDRAAVLHANRNLVLDTEFFAPGFKHALLESIGDLDVEIDGVLIKGENFQALNLIMKRYRQSIKCVYIDPPYNTGSDGFLYKDAYQHSSWLAMMAARFKAVDLLLADEGAIFVSIDSREQTRLQMLMDATFGADNRLATISVTKGTTTGQDASAFGSSIDYLLAYRATEKFLLGGILLSSKDLARFDRSDGRGDYSLLQLRKTGTNDRRQDRPNLYYPITGPDGVPVYPIGPGGYESCWRAGRNTVSQWAQEGLIEWLQRDGRHVPYVKYYSEGRTKRPSDLWKGIFEDDDRLLDDVEGNKKATIEVRALFGSGVFSNPKPTDLIRQVAGVTRCADDDWVLDYFAGSGTTGHAIIDLNRNDGGRRKYMLVEMGNYFDSVLKTRILKAVYSKDWRAGKPVSREGSSQFVKYVTLESYEDALNNLRLRERPTAQRQLLEQVPSLREDYLLSYCIDAETDGSASLLDLDSFETPFDYRLTVTQGGESRAVSVDLPETFNYLLGLRVRRVRTMDGFHTVEGRDPDGKPVLVIWRSLRDPRHSNEALDAFFAAQGYADRPTEDALDRVYVNGDNTLINLRPECASWQVLLTEEVFKRLMFAGDSEGRV